MMAMNCKCCVHFQYVTTIQLLALVNYPLMILDNRPQNLELCRNLLCNNLGANFQGKEQHRHRKTKSNGRAVYI
jgi:hypothetical protein